MVWYWIYFYYICGQLKKAYYMTPSNGWGSTVSRLQSHYDDTVYFQFLGLSGTHLIDLGRV